ncbi:hypothetical protein NKG94_03690 [Micromonospora sp. M12]
MSADRLAAALTEATGNRSTGAARPTWPAGWRRRTAHSACCACWNS